MKIKKIHIKNFKSLVDLEIVEPNPFTVFVGANGVGKSNIFEALEFANFLSAWNAGSALRLFGGEDSIKTRVKFESVEADTSIAIQFDNIKFLFDVGSGFSSLPEFDEHLQYQIENIFSTDELAEPSSGFLVTRDAYFRAKSQFVASFSRIFIRNTQLTKVKEASDERLGIDCLNLEKVLKRLLLRTNIREEITEYLQLLVPGLEKVEIQSSNLSGTDTLLIYEHGIERPFTKDLISDGTYNILCLLTAIFQSDEPQFLCIEEPENGLTPYAIEVLVDLLRSKSEERGDYIWLNTHSQTLVRKLEEKELILVNKTSGSTSIKQLKQGDFFGFRADDAWLTNALGAGLPW